MNRKIFLKLGLLLLSVSLVSCAQNNNSSKSAKKQLVSSTSNSENESVKTTAPTVENSGGDKQQKSDTEKDTQNTQDIQPETHQDSQLDKQEEFTENERFIVTKYNTVQDVCEYDLCGIYVSPKIEPLNNAGTYTSYEVQTEGNIYIDIIFDVKNINNEPKMTDDIIKAKIKIRDTEYTCFSVAENADSTDLEGNASIKPLETREIHYVAEVPKTEAVGEVDVTLTISGKNYSNKLHLEG